MLKELKKLNLENFDNIVVDILQFIENNNIYYELKELTKYISKYNLKKYQILNILQFLEWLKIIKKISKNHTPSLYIIDYKYLNKMLKNGMKIELHYNKNYKIIDTENDLDYTENKKRA
jgi:hypothetical protein